MATYDLVIRNGVVVDGTGLPRRRADVAVKDGRIAEVGFVEDRGTRESGEALLGAKRQAPPDTHKRARPKAE